MLNLRNKYCSNCLRTQRFLDLGAYLVCERCSKRLERVETTRRPVRAVVRGRSSGKRREAM